MRCLPPLWPCYSSGSCPQFMGESRQLESLALPYLLPRRPKYTRLPEIEKVRRDDPRDRPFETRYSTAAS